MTTKGRNKHRGEVLELAVSRSRISITEMVRRMKISRSTYYNHKRDPDLSFEKLEWYGQAIGYDFTNDFPEMPRSLTQEALPPYGEPTNLEDAVRQRDYWRTQADTWKNKYIQLLEEMKNGKG